MSGAIGKYDEDVVAAIEEAHLTGAGPIAAARAGGISSATYFEWMKSKPEFSERIKKALRIGRNTIREQNLAIVRQAASGFKDKDGNTTHPTWQAAAWILERMFKKEFGRFEQIQHEGKLEHKGTVLFDRIVGEVPEDARDSIRDALLQAAAGVATASSEEPDDDQGEDID